MTFASIWAAITTYAPMIISVASAVSAALPKAPAGSIWATIQKGVDWLALNFGQAKTVAPGTPGASTVAVTKTTTTSVMPPPAA